MDGIGMLGGVGLGLQLAERDFDECQVGRSLSLRLEENAARAERDVFGDFAIGENLAQRRLEGLSPVERDSEVARNSRSARGSRDLRLAPTESLRKLPS